MRSGRKSNLCIGLDTDINSIPKSLLDFDDPFIQHSIKTCN